MASKQSSEQTVLNIIATGLFGPSKHSFLITEEVSCPPPPCNWTLIPRSLSGSLTTAPRALSLSVLRDRHQSNQKQTDFQIFMLGRAVRSGLAYSRQVAQSCIAVQLRPARSTRVQRNLIKPRALCLTAQAVCNPQTGGARPPGGQPAPTSHSQRRIAFGGGGCYYCRPSALPKL
jgi:hypothetical protein